ncbi:hypothetical protein MSROBK_015120 [Spiroplasma poulsonii]|uniref:Uncharacterized protein n=1 Tax=Spiroplasma poulsonii TaxID=2138 RepID=A0A2P6FDW1_9MOLU|nr:hypothetical protein MSROBK_015120 [Spiroplasma poulsonii]PQM31640.1 hypothetical protein SMSRO_SF014850 [Spiroplasma poulsonii]PWF96664.1 hypothetical protein SMSE_21110 [Spiroplasma poulsonii]PWF97240.1 hypothetical protein SMH99_20490 [Spiroplasma poulsonii]
MGVNLFFKKRKCQICKFILIKKFVDRLYFKLGVCSMKCNRKRVDLNHHDHDHKAIFQF